MIKRDYICALCSMMLVCKTATRTAKNQHLEIPRARCYCTHPDVQEIMRLVANNSQPGFISFTAPNSRKPKMKTCPRWCPLKLQRYPLHITKKQAYSIVGCGTPKGLFYLEEGNGYTGIDNRSDDILIEEFSNKRYCINWLVADRGTDMV